MPNPFFLGGIGGTGTQCCCGSTSTKICVSGICGTVQPIQGAEIDLVSGSTVVASCTVDSTGCCTFTQSGTFTVNVYADGALRNTSTRTLNGTQINILITSQSPTCCSNCIMPSTLYVTDANGTHAAPLISGSSPLEWDVCYLASVTGVTVATGGANPPDCQCSSPTTISLPIFYQIKCDPNDANSLIILVNWMAAGCGGYGTCTSGTSGGAGPPYYWFGPAAGCSGFVAGGGPGDCNLCPGFSSVSNPFFDSVGSFLHFPWSNCNPFSLSATLPANGASTPNPVGTSVTISS